MREREREREREIIDAVSGVQLRWKGYENKF
jgi:hypothetical protein